MQTALKNGASLCGSHKSDAGSRTGTPLDHLTNETRSIPPMWPRCLHEISSVGDHMIGHDKNRAVNAFNPFFNMWMSISRKTSTTR